MDFSDALDAVKDGHRVRRHTWTRLHPDRATAYLTLVTPHLPDGHLMEPTLVMCFPGEEHILRAFSGSSTLLLADDWEILN